MNVLTWDDGEDKKSKPERGTEARETVFRMWEGGIRDLQEIATETGYSQGHIRHLLSLRGYSVRVTNTKTTEEVEAICADYLADVPVREVLKKHNISNNTLYALLDEQAIPTRKRDTARKDGRQKFLDEAVNMYQEGEPLKNIIAVTGFVPSTIYQELARRGIQIRSQATNLGVSVDRAVTLYTEDVSLMDIEAETGVKAPRLYKELALRNIPPRKGVNLTVRMEQAVKMYQENAKGEDITRVTQVTSTMLYKELRRRGLVQRSKSHREAQGVNFQRALELYDKGSKFSEIRKEAHVTVSELVIEIKKRGGNLRTGLDIAVGAQNIELAVQEYQNGTDLDTIEVDTLVGRVLLFAELNTRGIELRP